MSEAEAVTKHASGFRDELGEVDIPSAITNAQGDSLSVIWIAVTPVPIDALLPGVQLNESTLLVVLGLIPLVRAVFVGVPVVIVLVALVVIALVVLALSIFAIPIVLRTGRGHHRNRCSKSSGQKKRTEISVSTVHVGLLWCETHIHRIPLTSLSALDGSKSGQYCSDVLSDSNFGNFALSLAWHFCYESGLPTYPPRLQMRLLARAILRIQPLGRDPPSRKPWRR